MPRRSSPFRFFSIVLTGLLTGAALMAARDVISRAGEWRFQTDPQAVEEIQAWFGGSLRDRITLPGTMEERAKGIVNTTLTTIELSRSYIHDGFSWCPRDIDVPESWAGRPVELFMGRTRFTKVGFDDVAVSGSDRLSTPDRIRLTGEAEETELESAVNAGIQG